MRPTALPSPRCGRGQGEGARSFARCPPYQRAAVWDWKAYPFGGRAPRQGPVGVHVVNRKADAAEVAGHSGPPPKIVLIEHPIQHRIVPLPAPEHFLSRNALPAVAGFLQGSLAADVVDARLRLQPVQPQRLEGELRPHPHGVAAETFPPGRFLTDHGARPAHSQLPVDAVDAGKADVPVLVIQDRPHDLDVPFLNAVEPLFLHATRHTDRHEQVLRHLGIIEPADAVLQVRVLVRGYQPDFVSFQARHLLRHATTSPSCSHDSILETDRAPEVGGPTAAVGRGGRCRPGWPPDPAGATPDGRGSQPALSGCGAGSRPTP